MSQPAKLGLAGKTPAVHINKIDSSKPRIVKTMTEKEKYTKMWTVDEYRTVSPGELAGSTFLAVAKPEAGDEIIDYGCGTGRGGFFLWAMGGMKVTSMDFATNCLDADVKLAMTNYPEKISFIEQDLSQPIHQKSKYGYCTDVMEHIPEEQIDLVLNNILSSSRKVFFRISTTPDKMGPKYLKQPLHLTVKSYGWWAKKFLQHDAIILHSEDLDGAVDFYVTAWSDKLPEYPPVNTSEEQVLKNIRKNAEFGCLHVRPHRLQDDQEIVMLCGGPSLNDFEDEIIEHWKNGAKIVTVNGTYQWAQERGIHNVNQCVIDARPHNKRFVEPVRDDCFYFIGTQCDPSIFAALPKERTFYWHCTSSQEALEISDECYDEYTVCGGGSTVALRAILLMRVLGFKKQIIYGLDSCLTEGDHHAYSQPENDKDACIVPMSVGDRTFDCHPWMAYQATEFVSMVKNIGDEFMLDVKGDGLIAHILKTGASLPDMKE